MADTRPTRQQAGLAEMVEMLLDKGVVVNADVVVSVGDTELLGVKIRAAIASFETAAAYGLEFPEGTDMDRVEAAAGGERGSGLPDRDVPVEVEGATAPTRPASVDEESAAEDDEAAGESASDAETTTGEETTDDRSTPEETDDDD
ncbi:gas vesicle protein GvpJ [Haloarchaeobius sp. HRN-SO-5]|uniref:gas vesicle protein GvpJ n=1 Tax=Haloarchaeobius sp. HRN-SO-5 TaxID=3446118 RepID=UPI003EBEB9BB